MALASLCSDVVNKDSAVMAPLFAFGSYPRTSTSFTAFIVNHKLRGNSGAEAVRVAEELAKLDIESEILELDWAHYGDPASLTNVESIARVLRYQALGIACAKRSIKQLLLAHHADDQAETAMARILNKYVGAGLGGMRQVAPIPECTGIYGVDQSGLEQQAHEHAVRGLDGVLIERGGIVVGRPLLKFWKKQLVQICLQRRVQWFEDHTNADRALTVRNTIRFLQKDGVLPTALMSPRLLTVAHNIGKRREENERLAERIFADTRLILNLRSGQTRIFLPQHPHSDVFAIFGVQSFVLRKILQLVAPKDFVSLQDLHFAADFVFGTHCANEDDRSGVGEENYQIAGVSIRRNADARPKELEAQVFTFHRALPRLAERRDLQVELWSPSSVIHKLGDDKSSIWHLWDGRYWIRVSPPNTDTNLFTEVIARFLDTDDLAALRKGLTVHGRKKLEKALAVAKGDTRFTLPAIVAKQRSKLGDGDSVTERVVVLPSLNWSVSGWKRGSVQSNDSSWRWDIRYKHVALNWQGPHSVVP